jgi:hypothetical protein
MGISASAVCQMAQPDPGQPDDQAGEGQRGRAGPVDLAHGGQRGTAEQGRADGRQRTDRPLGAGPQVGQAVQRRGQT